VTAAALTPPERKRLAKLLELLASDQAGEVCNAGAAASRLIKAKGVTWRQVIDPAPVERPLPEIGTWRATVAECLAHPGSPRKWEIGFLQDLTKCHRISVKQRYSLKEIAARVLGRGEAGAPR
jgi:hypothetical protein